MKEWGDRNLVINGNGDVKKVPFPTVALPLEFEIKRPTLTTYEDGLEWNKQAKEHADKSLSFTQEYAQTKVNPYGDRFMVVNVSDLHWGHFDTDYYRVDHLLSLIENTPDVYCVFGWNLLDAAIPAQFPDGVMWSGQTAQEQVYTFNDKLKKLHAKNKIIGAIGDSSCHEGWMKRKTGWMIYRELFEGVDVPLLKNGGYLDVNVHDESYRFALFHKIKYWSQFNKTHGGERAMDRLVDAEIVFTSHLHQGAVGQTNRYNPPFTKETAVVSSGTCKLNDNFARNNLGKEGELPGQAIILWANRHAKNVVYNLEDGIDLLNQK